MINLSKNNIHNIPSNIKLLLSKGTIVNVENQIISEEELTTSAKLSLSNKVSVFENKIIPSKISNNGKYIKEYSDGTFKPNNSITRVEFVTIMNNYFGLSKSSDKVFNDTKTHWAKIAIDIAVTTGVCSGVTSTEFKPNDTITREQVEGIVERNYMSEYP